MTESFIDWLDRTKKRLESLMSTTKSDVVLWVIEHPDNGNQRPFYFGWVEGEKGWTPDIDDALKFDSEGQAEAMASNVGLPDYRIVDHKWLDHKPTSNLDVG